MREDAVDENNRITESGDLSPFMCLRQLELSSQLKFSISSIVSMKSKHFRCLSGLLCNQ